MFILKEPEMVGEDCVQGYAIDADPMNIILYKSTIIKNGENKGKINYSSISFHTSIESVLKRIYQLDVGLVGISDLEVLNQRVTQTIDTCVASLGKLNNIRGKL